MKKSFKNFCREKSWGVGGGGLQERASAKIYWFFVYKKKRVSQTGPHKPELAEGEGLGVFTSPSPLFEKKVFSAAPLLPPLITNQPPDF